MKFNAVLRCMVPSIFSYTFASSSSKDCGNHITLESVRTLGIEDYRVLIMAGFEMEKNVIYRIGH
jgi:hypothetical protein